MKTTLRSSWDLVDDSQRSQDIRQGAFLTYQRLCGEKILAWQTPVALDIEVLREEVQEWFRVHNATCTPKMRFVYKDDLENEDWNGMECIFEIDIADPDVAVLFKLTWGGS